MSIPMKQTQSTHNTVYIEYCVNCSNHYWCTKHNEEKYYSQYEHVKDELEKNLNNIYVLGNYSNITNKKMEPSIGAFEIKFRNNVIWSKLNTGKWPLISDVILKVKAILEGMPINDEQTEETAIAGELKNSKITNREAQINPKGIDSKKMIRPQRDFKKRGDANINGISTSSSTQRNQNKKYLFPPIDTEKSTDMQIKTDGMDSTSRNFNQTGWNFATPKYLSIKYDKPVLSPVFLEGYVSVLKNRNFTSYKKNRELKQKSPAKNNNSVIINTLSDSNKADSRQNYSYSYKDTSMIANDDHSNEISSPNNNLLPGLSKQNEEDYGNRIIPLPCEIESIPLKDSQVNSSRGEQVDSNILSKISSNGNNLKEIRTSTQSRNLNNEKNSQLTFGQVIPASALGDLDHGLINEGQLFNKVESSVNQNDFGIKNNHEIATQTELNNPLNVEPQEKLIQGISLNQNIPIPESSEPKYKSIGINTDMLPLNEIEMNNGSIQNHESRIDNETTKETEATIDNVATFLNGMNISKQINMSRGSNTPNEIRDMSTEDNKYSKGDYSEAYNTDIRIKSILKKQVFPIVKASNLRASKERPTKKKITLTTDEEGIHILKIEANDPIVIKKKQNERLEISPNNPYKLPLSFLYDGNNDQMEYTVEIYMDEKPWMAIYINVKAQNLRAIHRLCDQLLEKW